MMKISDYLKIFITPGFKKNNQVHYQLFVNETLISDLIVISHSLHFQTYNLLKKFKAPQYHTAFLMRKKQGFTTVFFQQHYDIVICDRYGNVIKTFIDQSNGYISNYFEEGHFIYFMVVGSIKHYNITKSTRLTLKRHLPSFKIFEDAMGIK